MVLAGLPLGELVALLAARTPTPGGGSAAAIAGAIGAALASMACKFSLQKPGSVPAAADVLLTIDQSLEDLRSRLLKLADEDAAAYEKVRDARKLPKGTEAEKTARGAAVETALLEAARVPLRSARLCRDGLEILSGSLQVLSSSLATDAASGAHLLACGCRSAVLNVEVNLLDLRDHQAAAELRSEVEKISSRITALEQEIVAWTRAHLAG